MLRLEDVTRTFGDRVAVEHVSLEAGRGETVVLLGPNGAGKTTLLRLMGGLLPPTEGRVLLNGAPVAAAGDTRRGIGLLTEAPGLWERLTVQTNLITYAHLQSVAEPERAVRRVLALLGLEDRALTRAHTLSRGLKQKVALARALLHEPALLLLDEPTSTLDPEASREVRTLIAGLRDDGRALVVSTHNLHEAEQIATRVAVVNRRLIAYDTPDALRSRWARTEVSVRLANQQAGTFAGPARRVIPSPVTVDGSSLSFETSDPDRDVPRLLAALVGAGAQVAAVVPHRRPLEAIYLDLMHQHDPSSAD